MTPHPTILLVDNDPIIRQLLSRFLEGRGYLIFEAPDGEDALVFADQYPDPIDLLVTDVVMPRVNGVALAAYLTQQRPETRVLYISGHFEDMVGVRLGLNEAGRPFLRKPFQRGAFLQHVDATLNSPSAGEDGFAVILTDPFVSVRPIPEQCPPEGIPRALRYEIQLQVRYRASGDQYWSKGVTANLSRSGILVEGEIGELRAPGGPKPALDVVVELPRTERTSLRQIRCHGTLARTVAPSAPRSLPSVAVAVTGYRVTISAKP